MNKIHRIATITIKCHHCSWLWHYKGGKMYATCPNCRFKTNVKNNQDNNKKEVKQK